MKLCNECKYFEWPIRCHYHYQDRIDPVDGGAYWASDNASDMRNPRGWVYFWFWNNCGKSGRLWEKKDDE